MKTLTKKTPVEFSGGRSRRRSGAACAEAAMSLPLLVLLVFGAIEMANAVFLRQTLNLAAYEAAKVVSRPGANEPLARTRAGQILSARRVTTYTLTVSPAVTTATARGTQITVSITAPASNLSYGPVRFLTGQSLSSTVYMSRL